MFFDSWSLKTPGTYKALKQEVKKMSYPYYAILVTGSRRKSYTIRHVIHKGLASAPVDGRVYKSLDAAMQAAQVQGIEITKTGDIYEII